MTLENQIRCTLLLLLLAAFLTGFGISTHSARLSLQQQLTVKNMDNATALGLSLSQMAKDPVTQELQVAAQFDTGHYRAIRIRAADGQLLVNKQYEGTGPAVPQWFVRLMALEVQPGVAGIQDGWKNHGTVELESQAQYAYETLWAGVVTLGWWFLGALGVVGLVGTGAVRVVVGPLRRLVAQAGALAQRRFVQVPEPRTPELKAVAQAMNQAVHSVQTMFAQEADHIQQLNRQLNEDGLTGLPVRARFLNTLKDALHSSEAAAQGWLVLVRVRNLADWTIQDGRVTVDAALVQAAQALRRWQEATSPKGSMGGVGRLNGSDFAALLPGHLQGEQTPEAWALALQAALQPALGDHGVVALAPFSRGEAASTVLARADDAMSRAKAAQGWHVAPMPRTPLGLQHWHQLLQAALAHPQGFVLQSYPVRRRGTEAAGAGLLHTEGFLRLNVPVVAAGLNLPWPQGEAPQQPLPGGDFIPEAVRLKLGDAIDLRAIELACRQLQEAAAQGRPPIPMALNVGADSIGSVAFRLGLRRLLVEQPGLAAHLWLEASEHDALLHSQAFEELAQVVRSLGVGLGLDQFGLRTGTPPLRLETLGLSYVKLHAAHTQPDVVGRLCRALHPLGIQVIATGVHAPAQIQALWDLGVDALTGPAIGFD